MAYLTPDRISMEPPFTNVGLDVFGPWNVSARRTHGGHAFSKRWAVNFHMFICASYPYQTDRVNGHIELY